MAQSFAKCSGFVFLLSVTTYLCNIGLTGLSAYTIAGLAKLWKDEDLTLRNQTPFVYYRLQVFDLKKSELLVWSIICCCVFGFTCLATLPFVCFRKKNPLCLAVTWIFSSIAAIIMAVAVTLLYILSYYGVITADKAEGFEEMNHPLETGVLSAAAFVYVLIYIILLVLVWKEYFVFKKSNKHAENELGMTFINGGGVVEEIGTPDDVPGYQAYTGSPLNKSRTRALHDRSRHVGNMYSEPNFDRTGNSRVTNNSSKSYSNSEHLTGQESVYANVERRKNTQPSTYRPQATARTNSDYTVQPFYEQDEKETRNKRYSQHLDDKLINDENPDPRCPLNTYSNIAYDQGNLYQIPRAHSRKE